MTTKAKHERITIAKADFTDEIKVPMTRKGYVARTFIAEGQEVEVTITQDARDPELSGPRAFVKWLERDPDTKVDFWINIGREHEIVLTSVYASDVLAIARAIESVLYAARHNGLIQIGEGEPITTKAVRRNGKRGSVRG